MQSLRDKYANPLIAKNGNIDRFLDLLKNSYKLNPQSVKITESVANAISRQAVREQVFYYHAHGDSTEFKAGDRILLTSPGPDYTPPLTYWLIKV